MPETGSWRKTAPGRLRRSEGAVHPPSPRRRCLSSSRRSASPAMSARILAIRADSSSSRASSLPVNIKFAGSGALHDSQAAIRRLKTVKPQAGHLNRDESVIEVGLQAAPCDMLHPAVRYPIPDSPDCPHLADICGLGIRPQCRRYRTAGARCPADDAVAYKMRLVSKGQPICPRLVFL